jgi:hypothetical protein
VDGPEPSGARSLEARVPIVPPDPARVCGVPGGGVLELGDVTALQQADEPCAVDTPRPTQGDSPLGSEGSPSQSSDRAEAGRSLRCHAVEMPRSGPQCLTCAIGLGRVAGQTASGARPTRSDAPGVRDGCEATHGEVEDCGLGDARGKVTQE